jgi:hypothetical protein
MGSKRAHIFWALEEAYVLLGISATQKEDTGMTSSETMRMLLEKANLVVEFLNAHPERFHPHMEIRISCDRVQIIEVLESTPVTQYLKD